jgi:hypothetical protein
VEIGIMLKIRNKKSFFQKIGLFLAVLGPGIITGSCNLWV